MAKWANYVITAVRYNLEHTHIVSVKVRPDNGDSLGAESVWNRNQVVSAIESGYSFVTAFWQDGKWLKGADVHVIQVGWYKYIRTDRNLRAADNLESLPEF